MWDVFVNMVFPGRQRRGLSLLQVMVLIALIGIFALGVVGCAKMGWMTPADNQSAGSPCAPDAAGIPPASSEDLICKIYPDPRDPHLLLKLAEAGYFAKYPQHADEALQALGEVRKALAGEILWEYLIGMVDNRFGNVMYAALGDELPAFRIPQVVSPRDKYFLLYAIGSYEGIARAGLAMRAQKK